MKKSILNSFLFLLTFSLSSQVSVTSIPFSSSRNAYGMLVEETVPLSYNADLNMVAFTHRTGYAAGLSILPNFPDNTTGIITPNSGHVIVKYSSNNGLTWNSASLFTATSSSVGGALGRYPSGVIANVSGNNDTSQACFVATGPCTGGSGWLANFFASRPANETGNTMLNDMQVKFTSPDSVNSLCRNTYFSSYCTTTNGSDVWTCGYTYDPTVTTIKGVTIYRGIKIANAYSWSRPVDALIMSNLSSNYISKSKPKIAFSPNGQIGYIVINGTALTNTGNAIKSIQPQVWKTIDGGNSWTKVNDNYDWKVNHPEILGNIKRVNTPNCSDPLGQKYPNFIDAHGGEITVDNTGKLHYVTTVVPAYSSHPDSLDYTFNQFGFNYQQYNKTERPWIWDFTTDGNGTWDTKFISYLYTRNLTTNETVGVNAFWTTDGSTALNYTNRIKVSRSNDGSKIFMTWTDSDTTVIQTVPSGADTLRFYQPNKNPNLLYKGLDVATGNLTPTKEASYFDAVQGGFYLYQTSEIVMPTVNGFTIPAVYISSSDGSRNATNAVDYNYISDLKILNTEYTMQTVFNTAPINSNFFVPDSYINGPQSLSINLINPGCGNSNGSISITSVTGGTAPYTFSLNGGSFMSNLNYSNLTAGGYVITVKDSNGYVCSNKATITTTYPPTDISISTNDPVCLQSNGSITIFSVIGGTPPYSYSINGGSFRSTTSFFNLAAGTYSISVKDANNCLFMETAILNNPAIIPVFNAIPPLCAGSTLILPTISNNNINGSWQPPVNNQTTTNYTFTPNADQCASSTELNVIINSPTDIAISTGNPGSCFQNNGIIALGAVTGGTSPYSYSFNGGSYSSTTIFFNLLAGTYPISVKDANNCVYSTIATLTAPLVNPIFNSIQPLCLGGSLSLPTTSNNGIIGTWQPPVNNQNTTTYTFTPNPGQCSNTAQLTVSVNSMQVSVITTNTDCNLNTGTAIASVTGGTAPYTYQWSSGSQLAEASELASGQYVVQVYDANQCNSSAIANINPSNGPIASVVSLQNPTCIDSYNGSLNLTVSGGVPPYSYFWNTGNTDPFLNNMPPGYYDLTITDANNCQVVQSYTLTAPPAIEITTTTQEPPCGSITGSITASASGGIAPYTYLWSATAGAQTTQTATNLAAGNYFVTVTDSNNCSQSYYTNLSNSNNNIQVNIDNVQRSNCGNFSTGAIFITATGGLAPYTYVWNNGSTNEDLTNLPAGEYVVRVGDALGCVTYSVIRVEPEILNYQPEICVVTVDTALSRNLILWEKPSLNSIKSYKLYREFTANNYQLLAEIPFASESKYIDIGANPAVRSWRYKLSAVDSCDIETPLSSKHKTMHLVQTSSLGGNNSLIWDFYEGFNYNYFYIWRDDPATGWVNIDSVPNNLSSYTDLTPPSNDSRYMIEIVPPTPCVSSLRLSNGVNNELLTTVVKSKSNIRNNRIVGIKSYINQKSTLKVYPNPAQNHFTIDLQQLQALSNGFEITIENTLGQRIYENITKQNKLQVNISQYQTGVYFVKVKTAQGTMLEKVVVE